MRKQIVHILMIFLLGMPLQGYAEVYKWVDEKGQTHYGEKPPSTNASEVKIKDAPNADMSVQKRNEESDKLLKVYEEERSIKNQEKLKTEEEERQQAEKCKIAENDLKDMQQGGAVYYDIDDKGERKFLSETELDQRIKKLQDQYNLQCK